MNKKIKIYLENTRKNFQKLKEMVASERFLSGFEANETISTQIITDWHKALDIYEDDAYLYPAHTAMTDLLPENDYSNFMCYDETLDPLKADWHEITPLWEEIYAELWTFLLEIFETPKFDWLKNLKKGEYIVEFIYVDLYNILSFISSADTQKESLFLEKQWQVYQNGGFPCGWLGEYPQGEIIVYSPK